MQAIWLLVVGDDPLHWPFLQLLFCFQRWALMAQLWWSTWGNGQCLKVSADGGRLFQNTLAWEQYNSQSQLGKIHFWIPQRWIRKVITFLPPVVNLEVAIDQKLSRPFKIKVLNTIFWYWMPQVKEIAVWIFFPLFYIYLSLMLY